MLRVLDCLWDPGVPNSWRGKDKISLATTWKTDEAVRAGETSQAALKVGPREAEGGLDTAAAVGRGSAMLGHWLGVLTDLRVPCLHDSMGSVFSWSYGSVSSWIYGFCVPSQVEAPFPPLPDPEARALLREREDLPPRPHDAPEGNAQVPVRPGAGLHGAADRVQRQCAGPAHPPGPGADAAGGGRSAARDPADMEPAAPAQVSDEERSFGSS